jgi:uncharacterized protein
MSRIGIIGGGVSGMATAWLLQDDHEVTLFECASNLGGHADTLTVSAFDKPVHAEYGARFFFDSAYPYFLALLRVLEVPTHWSKARVSFNDVAANHTLVLPPQSPRHVIALLSSPRLLRHVLSLRRLIQEQPIITARRDFSITFRDHLTSAGYPASFGPELAFPFLAACWGAPLDDLPNFPVYSLLKGMPPGNNPGFYEVEGGMSHYIETFAAKLSRVDVRLGVEIQRIEVDGGNGFRVAGEQFDKLVVATSSRVAARLLRDVAGLSEMQATVEAFRHFETDIVIHSDVSLMPANHNDWAHTNLVFDGPLAWMSDWQGIRDDVPVFRTWLPKGRAVPSPVYGRRSYHHLIMRPENAALQRRIAALQGTAGLWVTGMYTVDVDNHESALLSAIVPTHALAPQSENLRTLLGAVVANAPHGLEVLPTKASD